MLANQPQAMAGTLDIAASQKGARFVAFCDSFNLPLLTVVDTPGFHARPGPGVAGNDPPRGRAGLCLRRGHRAPYLPGGEKGLRRRLHRHGLQGHGQRPVRGMAERRAGRNGRPKQAVRIVHRREDEETQAKLAVEYREKFLNPYIAAERGYVDLVIDPAETRQTMARCLSALQTKRERLVARKHGNTPL